MRRIKDYYNWKSLRQWKHVLDLNNVHWKYVEKEEIEDSALKKALTLLENDCFPIAIICCCNDDNQKQLLGTSLWNGIFSFLNGKRSIPTPNGHVYFYNLDEIAKKRILDAQIASIWLHN